MITHLFVYGTLRPGDVRWPFLAPYAADTGVDDGVAGQVYDTGCGYPAAIFAEAPEAGLASIVGRTYSLVVDRLDEALALLDEVEAAVAGSYRRVEVTTDAGVAAWAYAYGSGLDLTPIPGNDWLSR